MTVRFESVAIIGTGLLGASLGLALKQHGLAGTVRGVGRRQSSLDTAKERGAIDEGFLAAEEAVAGADLVVICTPASSVPAMLDCVRENAPHDAVVTDVTSTKQTVCEHAVRTWPSPRRFVGSHPMAGSEQFGPEHATADLYAGRYVLVEPEADVDASAHATICALWKAVGAEVVYIDPAGHDRLLARTSHAPHIASSAVAMLAQGDEVRPFAGGGLRDITRVAAGRPELWRDICLTNADAVASALDELIGTLQDFRDAVARTDGDRLDTLFDEGRQARLKAFEEESDSPA